MQFVLRMIVARSLSPDSRQVSSTDSTSGFPPRCLIALLIACLAGILAANTSAKNRAVGALDFASIAMEYEVEIISVHPILPATTRWGMIEGTPGEAVDLKRYESLFCQEFGLYPKSLVAKSGLKRIILCQNLKFAGQRRYAVPDFEHNTYYLDVGTTLQPDSYLRKVIHHDFFHMVDYRDDGLLYEDERWRSLNPANFKYGNGGASALENSNTGELTDEFPGFLNHYSTTGVEEDKAEIFAHLIVSSASVASRMERDPVLADKVANMKALLKAFCPDIDHRFWENAGSLTR